MGKRHRYSETAPSLPKRGAPLPDRGKGDAAADARGTEPPPLVGVAGGAGVAVQVDWAALLPELTVRKAPPSVHADMAAPPFGAGRAHVDPHRRCSVGTKKEPRCRCRRRERGALPP